jgi:hypothetical protein
METAQDLVTEVLEEGAFDATPTAVLRWLNRRHRTMVARSGCWVKDVELGPSVADQAEYALPAGANAERLVRAVQVTVGGVIFQQGTPDDMTQAAAGVLLLDGDGGVMDASMDDTGTAWAQTILLQPAPGEDSLSIIVRGSWLPRDLRLDQSPVIPPNYVDALVAGAIATGLSRSAGDFRPDLAQRFEDQFIAATEELRLETLRRLRTRNPQIRVVGLNA